MSNTRHLRGLPSLPLTPIEEAAAALNRTIDPQHRTWADLDETTRTQLRVLVQTVLVAYRTAGGTP